MAARMRGKRRGNWLTVVAWSVVCLGGRPLFYHMVGMVVGLAGGITQTKKIAAIAESYHSALVTHNFLGPILTAASIHIDTSIPNFITKSKNIFENKSLNQIDLFGNEEKDEIMEEGAAKWSIRFKRSNESLSETLYLVYGHETRHFREVSSVQNTDVRWVDRY